MNDHSDKEIVFVILHYLLKDETIRCVESIRKNVDSNNYEIIIVDNASTNGTGEELKLLYEAEINITVLINKENLGFSRGNNIGFRYAKEKWNPEYVVLLNNDVQLLEQHFLEKLRQDYQKREFAVLGPLIMTKDGKCDINPMMEKPLSKGELLKEIQAMKRVLFFNKLHLYTIYEGVSKLKSLIRRDKEHTVRDYVLPRENVQLHGCFLVFSKKYTLKFDGLEERTFLYREEEILYFNVIKNNLKMVYNPNIVVFHEEFASSNALSTNNYKKNEMRYSRMLEASLALLEMYEEYQID